MTDEVDQREINARQLYEAATALDLLDSERAERPSADYGYYLVATACEIAGCTKRQFYDWLDNGYISFAVVQDAPGPIQLTRADVDDLRAFTIAMKLSPGQLARALLTSRQALRETRNRNADLVAQRERLLARSTKEKKPDARTDPATHG